MAEEAVACFASLLEKIPAWIEELKSVNSPAEQQQPSLAEPSHKQGEDGVNIEGEVPLTSIRQADGTIEDGLEDSKIAPPGIRLQTVNLTQSDALRLSQRKRKTFSVCSGDVSGPPKFRSRYVGVVHYDGATQKRFEEVVRTVAGTRNTLKKGRITTRFQSLSRSGSSDSENSKDDRSRDVTHQQSTPTLGASLKYGKPGHDDMGDLFEPLDKHLEKVQSLCERAAHQILRDGDCMLEVNTAKDHLEDAHKFVTTELPNLRFRTEQNAERRRQSEERRRAARPPVQDAMQANVLNAVIAAFPADAKLEVDDIDDESDEDDYDYGFDTTKLGMLAQMRTSRLTAH